MPYLCDVKNKLNSITMKYKSRSIAKVIVPVFLVVSLFAFTTHTTEQPEGTPLFITGITPYKSGMIVSQKGVQKVSIYSSDYKERLQEWELDEVPTGVATDGDQIYATVAGEHKNGVYFPVCFQSFGESLCGNSFRCLCSVGKYG